METPQETRLSITAAAKTAGVARSTIHRAIKTGRLSRNPDGTIDIAELHRVYAIRSAPADATTQSPTETIRDATVNATHEARLEQRVSDLERERDTLQQHLNNERDEKLRLLGVVESQQRLLTAGAPSPRRGFRDKIRQWWEGIQQTPER